MVVSAMIFAIRSGIPIPVNTASIVYDPATAATASAAQRRELRCNGTPVASKTRRFIAKFTSAHQTSSHNREEESSSEGIQEKNQHVVYNGCNTRRGGEFQQRCPNSSRILQGTEVRSRISGLVNRLN